MKNTLILGLLLATFACNNKSQNPYQKEMDMVEQNQKPFNPAFAADTTNMTLYFVFEVENGQIKPEPKSVQIAPVKAAKPHENGTFRVTTFDINQRELSTYITENPLMLRTCEEGGETHISYLNKGEISIVVPYTSAIAFLQMQDEGKRDLKPVRLDVQSTLKRLSDDRNKK